MPIKTDLLPVRLSRHQSLSVSVKQQQGMALLTVLLLVVVIVVIAGSMLASQKLSIRQTSLVLDNDQSRQNLQSGLVIAKAIIEQEQQTNEHDSVQDAWAKPIPPIDLDGQSLQINMADASSRFNLNNLYQNGQVNDLAYASLQSLLVSLGLESSIAQEILDFQDMDDSVYGDGGDERVVYADGGNFANQPFVSVEQLLALPSMDTASYQALRPFVSVSPRFLPINVNTAEPLLVSAVLNAKIQNGQSSTNTDNVNNQNNQNQSPTPTADISPEQLPDFRNNPLTNVEELWQQPVFQGYLNRQQQTQPQTQPPTRTNSANNDANNTHNTHNANNTNQGNNNRNHSIEQAKRMFAVSSQAFAVQVTATDAINPNAKRQRYVTALIVKMDETQNRQVPQQGFMIGGNVVSGGGSAQGWQIIYPRYWAYQPKGL